MEIQVKSVKYIVDESGAPGFWAYLGEGHWEKRTFNILDRFIKKGDTVMDIGCWIGPITLYLAAKGAEVLAIDPDPVAHKKLLDNIELNPKLTPRIRSYSLAIASDSASRKLYSRKGYGHSSSSLLPRTRDRKDHISIKSMSLQSFLEHERIHSVDFIKMDIEGGEFLILPDLRKTIEEMGHPSLLISFHMGHLNEHIYRTRLGVRIVSLILMKLENLLGFHLFQSTIRQHLTRCLASLRGYDHIYLDNGREIKSEHLTSNLSLLNTNNILITNRKWDSSESDVL